MSKLLIGGLLAAIIWAAGVPARAVESEDVKRAVDRGVEALRRMQGPGGTWPWTDIGATALAGLTLLQCGATPEDKAVQTAADAVRRTSVGLRHTYSISLAILFLDRLGDPGDVPLIESLTVRLMAGQDGAGGWTYDCPPLSEAEARRLQAAVDQRKELVGRRELPKPGAGKRTVKDLPEEIRQQVVAAENAIATMDVGGGGDNSNTQFAALALWVGRRQGLPVERALQRLEHRFRASQNPDGGWGYLVNLAPQQPNMPPMIGRSAASMTCSGLICLAVADASILEIGRERKPDGKPARDLGKDAHLIRGLQALGTVIDHPTNPRVGPPAMLPSGGGVGLPPGGVKGGPPIPEQRVGGGTYYFLWSMERVAVALDLATIGKKDWYGWGAEILLTNQQLDGSWAGHPSGADTCFALLFLKRANLARDLTAELKGRIKDPGERVIRAGGIGGDNLRGTGGRIPSGIESRNSQPIGKPLQEPNLADSEGGRLARQLLGTTGARQSAVLEQMRNGKGVQFTEALAAAIPRLEGEPRRKAREVLAERLTRMKEATLATYLQDEDAEIRRAAALACAMKESKVLVPNLIILLRDPEARVVIAAHAALKELTGQDFGPSADASREDRDQAVLKWQRWWNRTQRQK
jgi:hypothetical protein